MARPWYSFYPADYARDTGHLSLIEHGAYRVLMDHYYSRGRALDADVERLLRVCRANAPVEKDAVRFVLGEFFHLDEAGYGHARIDAEIAKAADISAKCVVAAKAGVRLRQQRAGGLSADAEPSQSQSLSQSQSQKDIEAEFEKFWAAYPRREARGAALRAFVGAREIVSQETLIGAACAYAARRQGQDAKFTRLAATWLKEECWLDDAPTALPADESAMAALWEGRAAKLVAEIGAARFAAWFAGAAFEAGPPVRLRFAGAHLPELVRRKFTPALQRAFGDFHLEAI